jgi:hypothetical protein
MAGNRRSRTRGKRRSPDSLGDQARHPFGAVAARDPLGFGFAFPCVVCGHGGRGQARVRFLPHGIHVWLCAAHGTVGFMTRDGGREFARRLQVRWQSSEEFGPRRRASLSAHLERVRRLGGALDKPGSHAWPRLRREAERRFAAGDDPATVIRELRLDVSGGPAVAPSLRSFRRWFAQGRWLLPAPPLATTHAVPSDAPHPAEHPRPHRTTPQRE